MFTTELYFEAHITVRPNEEWSSLWHVFSKVAEDSGFRASRFDVDEVDHYDGAWFLSYRSENYDETLERVREEVLQLRSVGFEFIRAKIENTLFDTKHGGVL